MASGGGGLGSGGGEMMPGSGGDNAASGGAGNDTSCQQASDAGPLFTRLPCRISETGLYQEDMVTLAPGVTPFEPRFPLWTDGAKKQRWILLPEGESIDTSDMDHWVFPAGTKLWKAFSRDDVRVETRLIEKQKNGVWRLVAYQWREDQSDADAVPNGVENASGTQHDIPDADACVKCHGQQPDNVLGFSAIQLAHDVDLPSTVEPWTLTRLVEAGLLSDVPTNTDGLAGTAEEQAFFGYVHANCGHCHNPHGAAFSQTGLDLWFKFAEIDQPIDQSSIYAGIVGVDIGWLDGERPDAPQRIAPGSLEDSAIYQRFLTKGEAWSMPPLGTELTDEDGGKAMQEWILSL